MYGDGLYYDTSVFISGECVYKGQIYWDGTGIFYFYISKVFRVQ